MVAVLAIAATLCGYVPLLRHSPDHYRSVVSVLHPRFPTNPGLGTIMVHRPHPRRGGDRVMAPLIGLLVHADRERLGEGSPLQSTQNHLTQEISGELRWRNDGLGDESVVGGSHAFLH